MYTNGTTTNSEFCYPLKLTNESLHYKRSDGLLLTSNVNSITVSFCEKKITNDLTIFRRFGAMLQSLRRFVVSDPIYTKKRFLNAITANMVMTAEPEQTDSPYHVALILKQNAKKQKAPTGFAKRWYSHLPPEIKTN